MKHRNLENSYVDYGVVIQTIDIRHQTSDLEEGNGFKELRSLKKDSEPSDYTDSKKITQIFSVGML